MTKITLEIDTDKPKDIEQAYNLLDSINQVEEPETPTFEDMQQPQQEQPQPSVMQHPTYYTPQVQPGPMMQPQPIQQQAQVYQQQQVQNMQQPATAQFQPNMQKSMPVNNISPIEPEDPNEDEF